MGFGGKYKKYPTPSTVVFISKIVQRIVGTAIAVMALFPETLSTKVITVILGGLVVIGRDFEDMFGVKVTGLVSARDVEVIKDEAIKILIFVILIDSYLFIF